MKINEKKINEEKINEKKINEKKINIINFHVLSLAESGHVSCRQASRPTADTQTLTRLMLKPSMCVFGSLFNNFASTFVW